MKNVTILIVALCSMFPCALKNTPNQVSDQIIEGIVLEKDSKEPLIGSHVKLLQNKNFITATVTDLHGNFKFEVPKGEYELEVSYPGYGTQYQKVDKTLKLQKFELVAARVLEEIVITGSKAPHQRGDKTNKSTVMSSHALSGYAIGINGAAHQQNSNFDRSIDWNTEDYDFIQENKFHTPQSNPLSTFSIDVDGSSYSNMRRYLQYGNQPPKDAIRIEELVNYFDYDYPQPTGEHPFSIISEMSDCPWQKDHKLVHIGLQGKDIDASELPPSNLVFLIDVSGSMSDYNKLPLVKQSFKLLLEKLRPQDRVAMVVYAGASGVVLNSISGEHKLEIKKALDNLQAGGSTAGASGIQLAYKIARENYMKNGNNRVILATDGDFNVGVSSDSELTRLIEKERESGTFLTVLGFGMGNYKDNKMQAMAQHGNGNHAYIDDLSEARKVFVNEFGGTLFTIAKDVKIQVEFNPNLVQAYRLVGYENRMLASEDFNDDKKDAGEIGAGHTVTALYEIIPVGVKSDFVKSVDDLKYQKDPKLNKSAQQSDEWMHVKFRYKQPDGDVSQLIDHVISLDKMKNAPSDNFNWSAAVASFGMILRESEFVGHADYVSILKMAEVSKGPDRYGYRAEFISMVENMRSMAGR